MQKRLPILLLGYALLTLGTAYAQTSTPPTISSISPAYGRTGSTITLNGQNLAGADSVRFDGGAGVSTTAIGSNTAASLEVTVPAGASTGPLTVTTAGGSGSSTQNFIVDDTAPATVIVSGPLPPNDRYDGHFCLQHQRQPRWQRVDYIEVSLDWEPFQRVSSPYVVSGLSAGPHSLVVQAVDLAGNVESPPQSGIGMC